MRRFRMVIILVVLAAMPLGVGLVVYSWTPSDEAPPVSSTATSVEAPAPPPPQPPPTRAVLAAARDLPLGTLLREDDFAQIEVLEGSVRRGYVMAEDPTAAETVRGFAVRETIDAGAPISLSAIVGPGQRGFLAAVLRPGTRAVAISPGPATSYAGLIDPGDRVDVILTATLRLADGSQGVFTRTILEDVRVVAIDGLAGAEAEILGQGGAVERGDIFTATLEVSPAQADRLTHGEQEGQLSLAVRALAGTSPPVRNEPVDLPELLSVPAEPEPTPVKAVRIIRGSDHTDEYFPEPGEVSPATAGAISTTAPGREAASEQTRSGTPTEPEASVP
jgi:pilus assembly protein CpaB